MMNINDPRLTAYVLGELSAAEVLEFEGELAKSPELKQAVVEIQQSIDFLKQGFADELDASEVGAAALGKSEVRTKLLATGSEKKSRSMNRWPWAIAATVLAAFVGYSMWQLGKPFERRVAVQNPTQQAASPPPNDSVESALADFNLDDVEVAETEINTIVPVPDGGTVLLGGIKIMSEGQGQPSDSLPEAQSVALALELSGGAPSDSSQLENQASRNEKNGQAYNYTFLPPATPNPKLENLAGQELDHKWVADYSRLSSEREPELLRDGETRFGVGINSGGMGEMSGGMGLTSGGGSGGMGFGRGSDRYEPIIENDFLRPSSDPLSTFSIDVDTASYSKVRSHLMNYNQLPPAGAVRIEELINYFPYDYAPPTDEAPFAAHQSIAICPWNPQHKLVRVALKGREIKQDKRPVSNLVFLLDVSGSMNESAKLPLVKRGIQMLINQLTENDRVAIVVYAGAAGTVLDSTTGDQKSVILGALDRLQAGGATNGGDGIRLAYKLALDHFITGGVNRVILCTDGDFNVGTTSNDELVQLVAENAKQNIFLSVLGFGMGNLNDSMLEQISNRGNGNYAFIDTDSEAKKVLVEQMSGTLVTIAKDVKIQVEFNPGRVAAYRLIGYENRVLAAQDFNDDKKDAGEIGAGHCVTALYEIIPAGKKVDGVDSVDELKYQAKPKTDEAANSSDEILTLKLRYKEPEGDTSKLLTFPLADSDRPFAEADSDFQFAAAVASFGMQLRQSKWAGDTSLDAVLEIAQSAAKSDESGYRMEFLQMVRSAKELTSK